MIWLSPLLATLVAVSSAQILDLAKTVGESIAKETASIKHPIEEGLVYIGSSQCSNVKKLVGVHYDQLDNQREPDLSALSLNFLSKDVNIIINITSVSRTLPVLPQFNSKKKLIIFLHGFTDDPSKDSFTNIRNSFANSGEYNVLALDASSLINWFYLRSSTYIQFIGERLGEVLKTLTDGNNMKVVMDPASIHLIGHSLGAHISSFAGKTYKNLTGRVIGRISGLDPAGPCFSFVEPHLRLMKTDAQFVDVIHTDSGVYGLTEAVGHVDFYPNGGSQQPECFFQTCSHSFVWRLYAESVTNPTAFLAVPCDSWDGFRKGQCGKEVKVMGYGCQPDTRGKYYLRTNGKPPYGLGREGTVYKNNEGIVRSLGNQASDLFG